MRPHPFAVCALGIVLAAGTLAAAGAAYGDDNGQNGKAELAAAAKVTIDQAVKTASEKVSGTIVEAELETKHKKLVWEIEVVTVDKKVMEVHIDADTGAVIDVEEEKAEPKKKRAHKD
ncbi:MAG: PepSY domain-containing protein [Nitrospira sp.]|nr:PepSY domain-containing protein [Nitrospira sp.]MBH0183582.1 PepSY domain-containing protein [Nitrospira sp.]MBH0187076.1 PepSY domain-containing protein [Nitrospira sp.]